MTYRNRKTATLERLRVMRVINCTGPEVDCRRIENLLLNNLLRQKLIRPGALVDADGEPSDFLYTIGPSRKEASGKPPQFQRSGFRHLRCQHCYFPHASRK